MPRLALEALATEFATGNLGTADLVDELGDRARSCDLQLRNYGGRPRCSGVVRTLRVYEDNALVKSTLSTSGEGQVLVVDGGGSLHTALVGDLIAGLAVSNAWRGLVLNGAIRDVVAISQLDIAVRALGSNPCRSGKTGAGQVDEPVSFGGVVFEPGDRLFADEDGILVVTPDVAVDDHR
jgi:regulator of ribonuclease activity A